MGGKWVVGAAIQLVGSVVINLGQNLMKLGHDKRAEACLRGQDKPIYRQWHWLVGWLSFALGNIANFSSYAFASQALLTALSSAQFVSNVLFAWLLHGESPKPRVLLATAIIIAGNVVLVAFANKSDPHYTWRQLRDLYINDGYVIYMTAAFGAGVPISYILSQVGLKKMAENDQPVNAAWLRLTPVAYSICSSLIGAQAVLFSTSLSILGRATLAGDNQLNTWFTAVLVLGLLASATIWITRLNQGLWLFEASVIIPMLQIIWILLIMVSGQVYFRDFERFSAIQLAMFLVGMALLLLGIYCLMPAAPAQLKGRDEAGKQWEEDATATIKTAVPRGSTASGAAHVHLLPPPAPFLLPALHQLDARALVRLPPKHLLGVLRQLQLVPQSEQEARELERCLEGIAREQRRPPQPARGLSLQRESILRASESPQSPPLLQQRLVLGQPFGHEDVAIVSSAGPGNLSLQHSNVSGSTWQGKQRAGMALDRASTDLFVHLPVAVLPGRRQPTAGLGEEVWEDAPTLHVVSNPLFEEQAADAAAGEGTAEPGQLRVARLVTPHAADSWAPHSPGTFLPTAPTPTPVAHGGASSPGASRLTGRRSSVARLTAAAKGAARGLRHSVVETVELLAGVGSNEHLKAASLLSMPMLGPTSRRGSLAASGPQKKPQTYLTPGAVE